MTREELSNMASSLKMYDCVLTSLENVDAPATPEQLLMLLNAGAMLQVAMLAEISDKLTQMNAEITEIRFSNEELRQMRHNEIHR